MEIRKAVLKQIKKKIQRLPEIDVVEVILFGSQASGSAQRDSDYDLLIILKNKIDWKTKRKIYSISYDIDLEYNIITDIHILSSNEVNSLRGKQPVYQNAIQEGIYA
ncbi:MAG TPA: nucleotidyltransferase domain-containing protein [Ignavibacteria bacterium]|nr:nucleotidyltransferase domain-containing protein [Ignavibacteria bacterium]